MISAMELILCVHSRTFNNQANGFKPHLFVCGIFHHRRQEYTVSKLFYDIDG